MEKEKLNLLSREVIGACIEVHKVMGPGLLEKIYEDCLMKELSLKNIKAERQVAIPLFYKGIELDKNYYIDVLVEGEIIVELKSVDEILPVFEAQIITYMKLANKRMGLLINFNVPLLKNGLRRIVNGF